jgi:hypothetical protein
MSRVGGGNSLNAINGRLQQYMQGIQVRINYKRNRDPRDSPASSRAIAHAYATSPGLAWSAGL